jgi:hypothetical protein
MVDHPLASLWAATSGLGQIRPRRSIGVDGSLSALSKAELSLFQERNFIMDSPNRNFLLATVAAVLPGVKVTFKPLVAAIVAAGLLASPSWSQSVEKGPFISQQPAVPGPGIPARCPDNHYTSAIQTLKSNNNDQRGLNIWCKPLLRVATMPSDMGEKGPFNTKEPVVSGGGPKAACLEGYYVSAIQLRVDGDATHQRSIDLWCKPLPKTDAAPTDLGDKILSTGPEPSESGGSVRIECANGYFISAVQIENVYNYKRSVSAVTRAFPKM